MRHLIVTLCVGAGLLGAAGLLSAQDGTAAASATGASRPDEVIFARRILMDTIGRNNDIIHDTVDGVHDWDPDGVRARLDAMSSMLLAFPHLYAPGTDLWSEEAEAADASSVSLSTPNAWTEFDAFYMAAQEASATALDAALTRDDDSLKAGIELLEGQCESCHARFRQPRTSGRDGL